MVKKIIAPLKLDCDHLLGSFLDKNHYDFLVTDDMDFYDPTVTGQMNEENLVFKFRKNVFSKGEQDLCYEGLIDAAQESQNRGLAAGPRGNILSSSSRGGREWVTPYQMKVLEFLTRTGSSLDESETLDTIKLEFETKNEKDETRGYVWLRSKVCLEHDPYFGWFDRWVKGLSNKTEEQIREEAQNIIKNYISDTNYAQTVMSGIAGYYSRYPRIPYGRATSFTEKNPEQFAKSFPFLRKLDSEFKTLLPKRYEFQRNMANRLDPNFTIDRTVFTTLTVNHNFRTAAHRDAGDLSEGFSNLSALGKGWGGAELILPEYRAAIKIQPGDLLFIANHTAIHANAPLTGENNDRLTIVAYFREDMLECGSWEYENLRKAFVDSRRLDKNHPLQRKLWNGVSANMWHSEEWYEFIKASGKEELLSQYHPEAMPKNSLESLFE